MNYAMSIASIDFAIETDIPAWTLEQMWRELEGRSDCHFFLSWDWIGSWLAEIDRPVQVLIGRSAGQVVVLGLLVPSRRRGRIPLRVSGAGLHTTGDLEQDVITIEYNGFLVARDCNNLAAGARGAAEANGSAAWAEDAAVGFLLGRRPAAGRYPVRRIDELRLLNVPRTYAAGDPDPARLSAASGADSSVGGNDGLLRELVWSKPSWRVDLDAIRASGKAFADTLSANTRQQIRRSMRLYEKQGTLAATRARDVPEALAFLDGLKSLHQPYWTGRGERGAFGFPFFERFQRRLIETCHPHGGVELIRVTRGDTAIGYLCNLVHRRHVYSYQSGFLFEDDPKLKPGLVSHCLCIEMHEREGDGVYDFMAGDNRYKSNLGSPGPDMHYVLLRRPTALNRLEEAMRRLRDTVRSAIRRR